MYFLLRKGEIQNEVKAVVFKNEVRPLNIDGNESWIFYDK